MYLNVVLCPWIFSWALAVSPKCDKRLWTNIFCFSLLFFLFLYLSFLSLCLYRQSWQHSIDLELQLMHFSELKHLVSSYANDCSRIQASVEICGKRGYCWASSWTLDLPLGPSRARLSQCLVCNIKVESPAVPVLQMDFWETGGIKPNASKTLSGG